MNTVLVKRIELKFIRGMIEAMTNHFDHACFDERLLPCESCEGRGEITVNGYATWDDPYAVDEIECEECQGTGCSYREVEPVECDDDVWHDPDATWAAAVDLSDD